MILSAYTVTTEPRGFAVCEWPATGKKQAEVLAERLSNLHANSTKYPNSFWVSDGSKNLCKFFRGQRYEPSVSV